MAVLNFDHTVATFLRIKSDLSKLLYVITILIQVIFIGYYAYQIVVNVLDDRLPFIIVYSTLAGISTAFLIYYLVRLKGMADRIKRLESKLVRRIYRISKYILKFAAIGLAIYEIVTYNGTPTMVLLTAFSTIALVAMIIAEIVILYVDRTIDRLILAYYMDREENILNKLISGELNRNNYVIPHEDELREKIKQDKDLFIKPAPEQTEPDPWWMKKAKSFINKQVNKRVSNPDDVIIVDDEQNK